VDFPGYGEGQSPGWDGIVDAATTTLWIPEGLSGWELSTTQDPWTKATRDFTKRLDLPCDVRSETTFVFLSSRVWERKRDWERKKRAEELWKNVVALDANDLEQWLEDSPVSDVWLAEELQVPSALDCMTPDLAWERWAEVTVPRLTRTMFEPSVRAHAQKIANWLKHPNPAHPFTVAGDSTDEALAFLSCLLRHDEVPGEMYEQVLVVEDARTLQKLAHTSSRIIPVVSDVEAESELAHGWPHGIAVRPRSAVPASIDIQLGLLGHETFEKSLKAAGCSRSKIQSLARESARSPTILRRRLSNNIAIKTPRWADNENTARSLLPMTLLGAWDVGSTDDCEVLAALARRSFDEVEADLSTMLGWNDSPVWSAGHYRGVASKIDALFAIAKYMIPRDAEDFLVLAEYVLSEADPSLELPPDQRWAAAVYDKVRHHSSTLRTGICETLVLLAVHGNGLARERLGIDFDTRVSSLVGRLLDPDGTAGRLDAQVLMSYDRDLPRLAEAAPDRFLRLLEADLRDDQPALLELLEPVDSGLFGDCRRTGLLWALECLAWDLRYLARVVLILAELSRVPIEDNWVNRPVNSLEAIFWSWMPQTAVSLEERVQVLKLLRKSHADVAWRVCRSQASGGPRSASHSYQPRWRSDAADAGDPVTGKERRRFEGEALELLLDWPHPLEAQKLGDLVDLLGRVIPEERSSVVWSLIENWKEREPDNSERFTLRERLRRFFNRSSRSTASSSSLRERVRELYDSLAPPDPRARHAWLFADAWIREWPEDFDEGVDFSERENRIRERRAEAMREIWEDQGLKGVLSLLSSSDAPDTVGLFCWGSTTGLEERRNVVQACLSGELPACLELDRGEVDSFLSGFFAAGNEDERQELWSGLGAELSEEHLTRLLLCAPFTPETWRHVNRHNAGLGRKYWTEVRVRPQVNLGDDELNGLAVRLLNVGRPRAAFHALRLTWDAVDALYLRDLLNAVISGPEPDCHIQIDAYSLCRAIESLNKRGAVTSVEMSNLEFAFFHALECDEYGTPNLERRIAGDPGYFVWLLALVSRRSDGLPDPDGWPAKDPGARRQLAWAAHSILDKVSRTPGTTSDGQTIDVEELRRWVGEARRQGEAVGRPEMVDEYVGQLLSRSASGVQGVWPCREVCEVIEEIETESIASGFVVGVRNSRGAVMRAEGGTQERELVSKYRGFARSLASRFPRVSEILEKIAESYEQEAAWWDSEATRRNRLEN